MAQAARWKELRAQEARRERDAVRSATLSANGQKSQVDQCIDNVELDILQRVAMVPNIIERTPLSVPAPGV